MLGRIASIEGNYVNVDLEIDISSQASLVGIHVVFEDDKNKIVGEIQDVSQKEMKVAIVGELLGNSFSSGCSKKPSFKSSIRIIRMDELSFILGEQQIKDNSQVYFGLSTVYSNYRVNVDINKFFSHHFANCVIY